MARSVVEAFNRAMGRRLDPERFVEPVRKALRARYTEPELRAAVWWAAREWGSDDDWRRRIDPQTLLKLQSPQGHRTLPQYIALASERWREEHDGEEPPWEANHA